MEISIKWNICRVCLQEEKNNDKKSDMHTKIFGDNDLAQNIFLLSGVKMKPNDSLPDQICQECLKILKYALHFRKKCRQSDKNLQTIIQRTKSASTMLKPDHSKDIADDSLCYDIDVIEYSEGQGSDEPNSEEDIQETENAKTNRRLKDHEVAEQKKEIINSDMPTCSKLLLDTKELNVTKINEIKCESKRNLTMDDDELENEIENVMDSHEDAINEMSIEDEAQLSNISYLAHKKLDDNESCDDLALLEAEHSKSEDSKEFEIHDLVEGENEDDDENELHDETSTSNLKSQNSSLYYIINGLKNDMPTKDYESSAEADIHDDSDDDATFVDLHDEIHVNLAEDSNDAEDNQSLVTSTVLTKEEIDIEEADSNLSQDMQSVEYIIDDNKICLQQNSSTDHWPTRLKTGKVQKTNKSLTNKPNLTCVMCGNIFSNRQLLILHMKIHRQEKKHECEICSKRFITACNLQAHMRIHTGEKPYECQYCERRFTDRSTHIRHERIHTNEKPFQCLECGKCFALATTLQAHLKVHSGERPYRCDPCDKSFKLAHQLKAHQNTHMHKAVKHLIPEYKNILTKY